MFFKQKKSITVIVPVYNERPFIKECISKLAKSLKKQNLEVEIIIVDDGSTDGTVDELKVISSEFKQVRLILQKVNRGKGAALVRGIKEASGDFILFQDADLEYDPKDINEILIPLINGSADVVYGSRFTFNPARKILNFHHQAGNLFLTFLSNLATGLNLTDMETGYKAFRSNILKTIPLRSERFGIEPEITAKIAKRHCVIYEVPITYNGRSYGEGKKITWKDGLIALYTIAKYWLIDDCYHKEQIYETFSNIEQTHHAQEKLVLRLTPYFGSKILEVGSGIGSISRILPVKENVTLTDWRKDKLELLKSGFEGKGRLSVEEFDFKNQKVPKSLLGKFDTVLFLHQLQYCENESQVLLRLRSLLAENGRLLIAVPGKELMGEYEKSLNFHRRYSSESLKNLLKDTGFRVVARFETNYPALKIWQNILCEKGLNHLPRHWAKISDMLVKNSSFFEKYLKLPGLTLVFIVEKSGL